MIWLIAWFTVGVLSVFAGVRLVDRMTTVNPWFDGSWGAVFVSALAVALGFVSGVYVAVCWIGRIIWEQSRATSAEGINQALAKIFRQRRDVP